MVSNLIGRKLRQATNRVVSFLMSNDCDDEQSLRADIPQHAVL